MAELEIEWAPEEQAQVQVRRPRPAFIADNGEAFEVPDLPEQVSPTLRRE